MAGNGDIRQKIVLEGEREYSAALKEAQRNLKVLRSELKAETAELGKNATEHVISRETPFAFYNRVYEGDTCTAYVLTGAFGIDYVADMHVKRRGR